ncbi:MAG: hypothetical protein J0M08_03280 [Bacteroidetes bacterium]|nr:hypothetical protein [Bacteroidota bacterium]
MENTDIKHKEEEKKSKNRLFIFIILVLALLTVLLGYLYWNETQKVKREIQEKIVYIDKSTGFQRELAGLKEEYLNLQTQDENLKKELSDKIAAIEELEKEAAKHKDDAYIISKLKKEASTLRSIMKHYVHTIDSLNTANQLITAEKQKVEADLSSEKNRSSQLSKEKEDLQGVVALGAILNCSSIKAIGINLKSGGKKEDETSKAKRAERIKVNYTIGRNNIAKKGEHEIFLRIISPDAKELTAAMDDEHKFAIKNLSGYYAAKKSFNYNNDEVSGSVFYDSKDGFIPGKYVVELYSDAALIGQTTLSLD